MRRDTSAYARGGPRTSRPTLLRSLLQVSHLGRGVHGGSGHVVENAFEIFQAGGGDDDGIAAASDVFGDAQETAARVFFEREQERLAFDLDFVAAESVFDDGLFRTGMSTMAVSVTMAMAVSVRAPVRVAPVWRWTFVRYHTLFPISRFNFPLAFNFATSLRTSTLRGLSTPALVSADAKEAAVPHSPSQERNRAPAPDRPP